MAKTMTINYNGVEYTLEYTRKSIAEMERKGFVASEVSDKPASQLPLMFAGAFYAHHRYVKQSLIDEIFDSIGNKSGLISALADMYQEPILALVEDAEESEGNAVWTANF